MHIELSKLLNSHITPYFQPIISLQTHRIIGYESLGRYLIDDEPASLGPFFHNKQYSQTEQLQIDRFLHQRAIEKMTQSPDESLLFINFHHSWALNTFEGLDNFSTMLFEEQDIFPTQRIVIEITEDEFRGSSQELCDLVRRYRQKGCMIAIDDVGSGFSNIDRIARIEPDILKIDLQLMKNSCIDSGFNALIQSYCILAEQMGSSLLIEGIETDADLQIAIASGARYVQGFLFSQANVDFLPQDQFADAIQAKLILYASGQRSKHQELHKINEQFDAIIGTSRHAALSSDPDPLIEQILDQIPLNCMRIYLCREDGTQLSSNYSRDAAHKWQKDESFRGVNWIWRPYFIQNMVLMQSHRCPSPSHMYTDLATNQIIYTYSGNVHDDQYLFFDLTV